MELTAQAAMRLMSASVFTYDFLVTLPSEFRLYKRQIAIHKLSIGCLLFICARYFGVIYIISTSVLFFSDNFTLSSCKAIVPIGAFFRGAISSASALVFLWRTWAIWNRKKWILIIMGLALIPTTIFSYASAFTQTPIVKDGGCTGASGSGSAFALKWPFALVYDTLACALGSYKLISNIRIGASHVSAFLLADGLGYFFVMIIVHALNLMFLLHRNPDIQTVMVTFQAVITSILAQRIITALAERTKSIYSSKQESSHATHEQSHSRSRNHGIVSKPVGSRPAPSPWKNRSILSQHEEERSDVELVKIQVDTETIRDNDRVDGSGSGIKIDLKRDRRM